MITVTTVSPGEWRFALFLVRRGYAETVSLADADPQGTRRRGLTDRFTRPGVARLPRPAERSGASLPS